MNVLTLTHHVSQVDVDDDAPPDDELDLFAFTLMHVYGMLVLRIRTDAHHDCPLFGTF